MADVSGAVGPIFLASKLTLQNTGALPPNHLGTDVPSGTLVSAPKVSFGGACTDKRHAQDEKRNYNEKPEAGLPPKVDPEDEEEDEDIDALIEELESQDAAIDYEDDEVAQPGGARNVPEELLQTDTRLGLTSSEVLSRRKKYGMNQMKGAYLRLHHATSTRG
jgi:H+-transporting ATPase